MVRLDKYLVEAGLVPTRSRALSVIREGFVRVNGRVVTKPAMMIAAADVRVDDPNAHYVSRAALKLLAIIGDVAGRRAVDLGASTGGFTQVLLERGAVSVVAIDVGHDQLAPVLRKDARVNLIEGLNAKDVTRDQLAGFDIITADLSFISLKKALPPILALAETGCDLYALVKPQFELEPGAIGKNGLVKTPELAQAALDSFVIWITAQGWKVQASKPSPIKGGDGNQEFLVHARK